MPGQIKRTDRIRKYISDILDGCKPGTVLFTSEISRALCVRHHGESNKDVGMAMRERTDVINVREGVWRKR